jgi:alpha-amylase/alpha-mannosidase (GH57 family)
MHQPDYRGPDGSEFQLPWVYLHGIKDYVDMAAHIEAVEGARAVVNFAPVLLEQLDEYARQTRAWLDHGKLIRDPLLAALAGPGLPLDQEQREALLHACLRANEKHLIDRFPAFKQLADLAQWVKRHKNSSVYLNDQFLIDLLVWYHLAWMGETIRQNDLRVQSLQKKKRAYSLDDRRHLISVIHEQLDSLTSRYRRLSEQGKVELSVTPYAHPIMPLLLDIQTAKEASPDMALPDIAQYPGGDARVRWHIRKGSKAFERHFGVKPRGCWPSEGAVSEETLRILEEEGFAWAATGQQVLHNSLLASNKAEEPAENWLYQAYRSHDGNLNCFFRDDGLSDLIGFTYADWHADDAVANLLEHLEAIEAASAGLPDRVASIIMDGENAWEYFPHNGSFFLPELYRRLVEHPALELTTYSDFLSERTYVAESLNTIVTGSWVYGTLSTWIGDPDKNKAWEMLSAAKRAYDQVISAGSLDKKQTDAAKLQLARCEGSDWFWWFGDYNPGEAVSDFERLFRSQLVHLYHLLGQTPPDYLFNVFARGSGKPDHGGVMRKS